MTAPEMVEGPVQLNLDTGIPLRVGNLSQLGQRSQNHAEPDLVLVLGALAASLITYTTSNPTARP